MKRIDEDTVELTTEELQATEWFAALLERGWNIPVAAKLALNRMRWVHRSDEFIAYLSRDTCRRWGSRVLVKPEFRDQPPRGQR